MRRSPRGSGQSDANPGRRPAPSALCGLLALAASCASPPAALTAPAPARLSPGELRVALVFGSGADLDLYLTDPSQETVYYANTPSQMHGGRLENDLRCDAAAPRVETIVFSGAPPGRYWVGVDRAETCSGGAALEPFLLTIEASGEERLELRSEIARGRFLPRVLEFTLPEAD